MTGNNPYFRPDQIWSLTQGYSFGAHKKVFSRSAMSRRSLAVTCAYRLTIAAFDQPMTSITAHSGTPRSNGVVAAV
jgi:hypothetical protein